MIGLILLYASSLCILAIDWASMVKSHKVAFFIEASVFAAGIGSITYLYSLYGHFYSNGGRKIDIIIFMWLCRELIQTRVKFNESRREVTSLVSSLAVKNVTLIKSNNSSKT
jgi:hypothetical protein